jgi:RING finger protein 113A
VERRHNAKTSKCAVCEQATQGIFNVAQDILKKMKRGGGGAG